ncbi:MAG: metallophosphoesterase [Candidatus Nanohaloarchaea archaeon]
MTDFKIIGNYPAIYFPELDLIAISDLHLGLEASMTSRGNYIPEFQLDQVKEELEEIRELTGCDRILINGDLKNQYSTSYSEKSEIDDLVGFLTDNFQDVIIIKGNHDTFIDSILEEHGLRPLEQYEEDGVLFTHGDERPEQDWSTIVIGHEHPALALEDDIGVTEKVDALLHLYSEKEIFVLPAYSPISNGSEINRMSSSELLSPILKDFNLGDFEAYAISREAGVFDFGKLHNL